MKMAYVVYFTPTFPILFSSIKWLQFAWLYVASYNTLTFFQKYSYSLGIVEKEGCDIY